MDSRSINVIIDEAMRKIIEIEPGTIIPHLVLSELLDINYAEERDKYYGLVSRLKKELIRNHGIFLKTEHKMGYSLSKRGEEIDLCYGEMVSGVKKVGRAVSKTAFIRVDEIKDSQNRERTIVTAQKMANTFGLLRLGQPKDSKHYAADAAEMEG